MAGWGTMLVLTLAGRRRNPRTNCHGRETEIIRSAGEGEGCVQQQLCVALWQGPGQSPLSSSKTTDKKEKPFPGLGRKERDEEEKNKGKGWWRLEFELLWWSFDGDAGFPEIRTPKPALPLFISKLQLGKKRVLPKNSRRKDCDAVWHQF